MRKYSDLCEEDAKLFKRLQKTDVLNLFNYKDTFGWLVPGQPLTRWVLDMPVRKHTHTHLMVTGSNYTTWHLAILSSSKYSTRFKPIELE